MKNSGKKTFFYCRKGLRHTGPLSNNDIRRQLAAGMIDAQTLVSTQEDGRMLPLGASAAAGEITNVVHGWRRMYSLKIYFCWLLLLPVMSAYIAAVGLHLSVNFEWVKPFFIIAALSGIVYWLYRTWSILLADKPPAVAALYALPMMLPVINCLWIWEGYLKLPEYWNRYRKLHNIAGESPQGLYLIVVVLFYLSCLSFIMHFFVENIGGLLMLQIFGCMSWLWFGLTLMSLFVTDRFATAVIQKKLSNLAFGSLRFCADINYDVLHRAVLALSASMRRSTFIAGICCLSAGWIVGGWFWMYALEVYHTDIEYRRCNTVESCQLCKVFQYF